MRRTEQRAAGLVLVAAACAVVLLGPAAAVGGGLIAWGLWRAGWIGSTHRITSALWLADGRWILADGQGNEFAGELSADTRRVRQAVWLSWNTGRGRRRSMLLTPGDLPSDCLRALATRLPIEAAERALPEARTR
jgi:hypothetical protein